MINILHQLAVYRYCIVGSCYAVFPIAFVSASTASVEIRSTLNIYYIFRSFGHQQVCIFIDVSTAHPLRWPVFTVGIFCVAGLIYWVLLLSYSSLLKF
jgi:hypothetical protein